MEKVYVTHTGQIALGSEKGNYPLLTMKRDGKKKWFCSSCGNRIIDGDKYIVETDTERHCYTCLTIDESKVDTD